MFQAAVWSQDQGPNPEHFAEQKAGLQGEMDRVGLEILLVQNGDGSNFKPYEINYILVYV